MIGSDPLVAGSGSKTRAAYRGSRARQHCPGKVASSACLPAGIVVYSFSVELPESQKSSTSGPSSGVASKMKWTWTRVGPASDPAASAARAIGLGTVAAASLPSAA